MNQAETSPARPYGAAEVHILPSPELLGQTAAERAAKFLTATIASKGKARIFIATGNSQLEMIKALVRHNEVDWKAVEVFHLDEYVGISASHPSSFRFWIKTRFEDVVHPGQMHYLQGDAHNIEAELARYSALIKQAPIDLAFVGIGENGHIAFNDPPVADFHDPSVIKRVVLDDGCRKQQAGEGHFESVEAVPKEAVTVTCSTLLQVDAWISCIPDARKAKAVRDSLEGPIATTCPGSLVRQHPNSFVYLDTHSAALLSTN